MAKKQPTKLIDIINSSNKVMSVKEKLGAIYATTNKARKAYGNTEEVIEPQPIEGWEGSTDLIYLSNEDKLAAAACEIRKIRIKAIENTKAAPGVVLENEFIKLIAINPLLTNLEATIESNFM